MISLGPGRSSAMTIKFRNEKKTFVFEASRVLRKGWVYFSHKDGPKLAARRNFGGHNFVEIDLEQRTSR